MNTASFKNFARYDLTTSKVFYKNMAIMAVCLTVGITALCFLGRWAAYHDIENMISMYNDGTELPLSDHPSHYSNTPATLVWLLLIVSSLPCIFAGCCFHSFRKKQGRINEMTIPATNKEKYLWHILLCVGGGIMLSLCSLVAADFVNFILHICTYGFNHTYSLTARFFEIITFSTPDIVDKMSGAPFSIKEVIWCIKWCMLTNMIMQISAYIYGNSVKYKYNIIITYAILLFSMIAILIVGGQLFAWCYVDLNKLSRMSDANALELFNHFLNWMWGFGFILLAVSVLCIWRSYKRYCDAQITTVTNK